MMYSKFVSESMAHIPRVHSLGCLSLKIASIMSACLLIVYCVLSLGGCTAALGRGETQDTWSLLVLFTAAALHLVTLFLTALMLVGALREKAHQMRPWVLWSSLQVSLYFLVFLFLLLTSVVQHPGGNSLLYWLLDFLTILVRFYMVMVVANYCRVLEDQQYEQCAGQRLGDDEQCAGQRLGDDEQCAGQWLGDRQLYHTTA